MEDRYLFRGKTRHDGIWVEGYFFETQGFDCETWHIIHDVQDACGHYLIDPDTLCQGTGLRDKNEELIFEGDFISYGGETYLISFTDACYWITQDDYSMELHTVQEQDIEVVGNVHDNPELLANKEGGSGMLGIDENCVIQYRFACSNYNCGNVFMLGADKLRVIGNGNGIGYMTVNYYCPKCHEKAYMQYDTLRIWKEYEGV